jgi:glycerol-3-phosphate O-acyltransferase
LSKLYSFLDRVWQWIAETIFVRFDFDLPTEKLKAQMVRGKLIFALVDGGLIDWFILSSWCRSQGLGAVSLANRKRILFFSKPLALIKVVLGRQSYADLFTSDMGEPRLICFSGRERKKINVPTPTEALLSGVYARASSQGELGNYAIVPVFILWKRHMRGAGRRPSEYLFGMSSKPNSLGKLWFLLRRRTDSTVTALGFLPLASKETLEKLEGFDENESMRAAKSARRKVLVWVQQEMRVLLGPRYHSPSLIKETVLRDPEIQSLISRLAEEEGIDRKKVMSRAYQNLTEIVSDYRFRLIEVMYALLTWLFSKVFDGVNAKDEEWAQVRELMKTKPVAFIPCHRSHLDYLVIPYLLFNHDMVTPHVAAGINLSFWPVGHFLRMGGAFFIRRSFRGDPLYSAILNKYVQTLLKNRYNLKFFIEGTRSRSGKMLAPAYGMLKMVMDTYSTHVCEDIALIPVSICYDEVPEQSSYSKELGGGQKVAESAMQLIKSRKIIRRRFGKVYVRLGKPMYASEFYKTPESDARRRLQKTAFQVCKTISDITPITPKSLVSTALLCHRNPLLTLEEVLRLSLKLSQYVEHAGMELSVPEVDDIRRSVEQTLRRLRKSGTVLEIENVPRRYVCDSRRRTLLNFYKNNAIHCFVIPGIALLAYYRAWQKYAPDRAESFEESFKDEALALRDILKFEFFFNPRAEFLGELEHSAKFLFGDVQAGYRDPNVWAEALASQFPVASDLSVLSRVPGELLESYLLFADFVRHSSDGVWEKRAMLSKVYRFAEMRQQQGDVLFPESLSVVNYGNALLYLENQGVLKIGKEGEKTQVIRIEDSSLASTIEKLSEYRDLMQEREETFLRLPAPVAFLVP